MVMAQVGSLALYVSQHRFQFTKWRANAGQIALASVSAGTKKPGRARPSRTAGELCSAQAGDVVGHGPDLAVVQLGGHAGHLEVVVANAATVGRELGLDVVAVLASQTRVLQIGRASCRERVCLAV